MLASEMIEDLKQLIQDHGDHDVVDVEDNPVMVSFAEGDEEAGTEPAFVVE